MDEIRFDEFCKKELLNDKDRDSFMKWLGASSTHKYTEAEWMRLYYDGYGKYKRSVWRWLKRG